MPLVQWHSQSRCMLVMFLVDMKHYYEAIYQIDVDQLGWWLCERQTPSGGFNGRPEKALPGSLIAGMAKTLRASLFVLRRLLTYVTAGGSCQRWLPSTVCTGLMWRSWPDPKALDALLVRTKMESSGRVHHCCARRRGQETAWLATFRQCKHVPLK